MLKLPKTIKVLLITALVQTTIGAQQSSGTTISNTTPEDLQLGPFTTSHTGYGPFYDGQPISGSPYLSFTYSPNTNPSSGWVDFGMIDNFNFYRLNISTSQISIYKCVGTKGNTTYTLLGSPVTNPCGNQPIMLGLRVSNGTMNVYNCANPNSLILTVFDQAPLAGLMYVFGSPASVTWKGVTAVVAGDQSLLPKTPPTLFLTELDQDASSLSSSNVLTDIESVPMGDFTMNVTLTPMIEPTPQSKANSSTVIANVNVRRRPNTTGLDLYSFNIYSRWYAGWQYNQILITKQVNGTVYTVPNGWSNWFPMDTAHPVTLQIKAVGSTFTVTSPSWTGNNPLLQWTDPGLGGPAILSGAEGFSLYTFGGTRMCWDNLQLSE